MKTAIIFSNGLKQIIFTPENNDEKLALSLITSKDEIDLAVRDGGFGNKGPIPFTANISMCAGNFLRVFSDETSKILVLKPKDNAPKIEMIRLLQRASSLFDLPSIDKGFEDVIIWQQDYQKLFTAPSED